MDHDSRPQPDDFAVERNDGSFALRDDEQTIPGARIGLVQSALFCDACDRNLIGCDIVREKRYGLHVARCPSCGQAAALDAWPERGPAPNRFQLAGAIIWIVFLIGALVGTAATLAAISSDVGYFAANDYDDFIRDAYNEHLAAQFGATAAQQRRWDSRLFRQWWETQDASTLFAEAGGWRGVIDWEDLFEFLPLSILLFIFGVIWGVFLTGFSIRRRVVVWCVIVGVAFILASLMLESLWAVSALWMWVIAQREIAVIVMPIAILIFAMSLLIGMLVGPAIVRALICAMLVPRLRRPFTKLWSHSIEAPITPARNVNLP